MYGSKVLFEIEISLPNLILMLGFIIDISDIKNYLSLHQGLPLGLGPQAAQ